MDQLRTFRAPVTGTGAVLLWQSPLMPTYSRPAVTTLACTSAAFSVASER